MSRSLETSLVVLLAITLMLVLARFLSPFVGPFLCGLILAAFIDSPANLLENLGLPRGVAVIVVLGILATLLIGLASLAVLYVVQDMNRLADQLPHLQASLAAGIAWVNHLVAELPAPLVDVLRSSAWNLTQALEVLVRGFFVCLAELPGAFGRLVVAILAAFFLARDGRLLAKAFIDYLPPSWRQRSLELNRGIFVGLVGFVRAQILLISVSAVLCTLSLLIFGVPYAWLLGILAGILDLMPVTGPSFLFVPIVIWHWLAGSKVVAGGLATSLGLVLLVRQTLEPSVVGSQAGLHPFTSLTAVYLGVRVWGISGVIIGPLLAITAKALWLGALRPLWFSE